MELPQSEVSHYLEEVEDIDLHIELFTCFNFYREFSDAINYNMSLADKKREELNSSISEMAKNGEINISKLQMEKEKIGMKFVETEKYYVKKKSCWNEFYDKDMLRKFNEVLIRLNDEIETVKLIKQNGY
ncbi:hypothetical protein [Gracilibacillus salinarum]|uniref:Uncharacterized protein n=1 Tax=Gracilibacillus salinarum TaxID=2932255 RepID=A0ABY4GIG8_9BACI|nr:hypothetical protein [Gracilibacillus salinarum]UOQ83976.1 hypothetical protein MUN87_14705 [Gracilibacillus salinarum]